MSDYKMNPKFDVQSNDQIIELVKTELSKLDNVRSISRIIYKIISVGVNYIQFSGKNRNNGDPEEISYNNMKSVIGMLKNLKSFNTSNETLKREIPNKIYKIRSPLFAILLSSKVIIRV